MKRFPILLYFFIQMNSVTNVSGIDENLLPSIFNITDVETCPIGHFYCKLIVKLEPRDHQTPPEIWNAIEKVNKEDRNNYRRDILYRTVCVKKNALEKEYSEYSNNGLVGWVDKSFCYEKKSHGQLSSYDKYFGLAVLSYLAFLVYSTIKTNSSNESSDNSCVEVNKYIKIFSITNTWKEIKKQNRGEDFNKLLSIQGIRTLAMLLVISAHNFMTLILSFSYNPEYLEQILANNYTGFLVNSFGLAVQTFFTISAWLLAVQLNNIVKKNGKFTMKDIAIVSLNRYFRLIPSVILIIIFHQLPAIGSFISELLYRSITDIEQTKCRNAWWLNFFFIQNWSCFRGDICSAGTWYIAVDTQLYLLAVFFFYLSQKFKISIKYFFGLAALFAMSLQVHTVMTTTFDALVQFSPRMMPMETVLSRPEFLYSYTGTECSLMTYVIGFIFGSIYVENKHKDIFDTPMKKVFWLSAFIGLPFTAILFYQYRSWRIIEAILAISIRPLFSLGIAIGILGMATNTGGFIKKFFEWRPLVFMGSFSYSVYMFQFGVIFGRLLVQNNMTYLSHFSYVKYFVQDIVLSFTIGIIMYVIFEHPCLQLQKLILPQLKTTKKKDS